MPRKLCRRCEFLEQEDRDAYCYRYPPKLVVINKPRTNPGRATRQEVRSEYPTVDKDIDWCGEFKKKEEEDIIEVDAD